MKKQEKNPFQENIKTLQKIAEWFEQQEDMNIEAAMEKISAAAPLILEAKRQLSGIENMFEEIKMKLEKE